MEHLPLQGCGGTPVDALINWALLGLAAYIFYLGWQKRRQNKRRG
jgi:hypothetical protein